MSLGIQESTKGSLSKIMQSFSEDERWHHNAANDTIYTLLPALLFGMYPRLYPDDVTNSPKISTPIGTVKTSNEVLPSVSAARLADGHPALGYGMFCFYCNTAEDHAAEQCQNRALQEPCQLCGSVDGYYNQAKKHPTDRYIFEFNHSVPEASLLVNRLENLQLDDTGYEMDYTFIEAEWTPFSERNVRTNHYF